jgi:hypothetical protein
VPIAGLKGGVRQAHAQNAEQQPPAKSGAKKSVPEHSLSNDTQLLAVFRLAVWICRQPDEVLTQREKTTLLTHAVQNLNVLSERARSVRPLLQIVEAGQADLLELCVVVLCLGDAKLLRSLQTLLETRIALPPQALVRAAKYREELEAAKKDEQGEKLLAQVTAYVDEERQRRQELLRHWIQ